MSGDDSHIRSPAVAGLFYPDDAATLRADVESYLQQAKAPTGTPPKAIIAPHAGYMYSGPVAASAYRCLQDSASKIRQVVLLGPSHRIAFSGIATPTSNFFTTPLGAIKINTELCHALEQFNFVKPLPQAHQQEHSLEVHLPFLQVVLSDFELTPLVVGNCDAESIALLLEQFWDCPGVLVIVSSDLSHYHNYHTAIRLDRNTSDHIEHLQPEKIHYDDACGRNPLNGLLVLARQKHLSIETLDLRNSGDTAGDKDRVVGYGAYVVH